MPEYITEETKVRWERNRRISTLAIGMGHFAPAALHDTFHADQLQGILKELKALQVSDAEIAKALLSHYGAGMRDQVLDVISQLSQNITEEPSNTEIVTVPTAQPQTENTSVSSSEIVAPVHTNTEANTNATSETAVAPQTTPESQNDSVFSAIKHLFSKKK